MRHNQTTNDILQLDRTGEKMNVLKASFVLLLICNPSQTIFRLIYEIE